MSDMEVQPDPITRTALRRLPIPAHGDAFWSELGALIDAEAPGQTVASDGRTVLVAIPDGTGAVDGDAAPAVLELEPDPALAIVPRALRRTSNALLLAVAAAAAVVVTLAGTTLLEQRSGTDDLSSDELAQSAASLGTTADGAEPDDATPAVMSEAGTAESQDAVLAWVDDLGSGDGTAAWQAMGAASQAHFGSQESFEAEMSSLADGYGAWSAAEPDDVLVTPVLSTADVTVAVVTLIGMVDHDGTAERRADAFPVRIVDGEAVLEPFAFAGAIEVVVPETTPPDGVPTPVEDDEELVVVIPSGVEAPILRVDDGDAVVCGEVEGSELTDLEGAEGQRCAYLPPEGLTAGEHTLTMAFVGADGTSISAGSVLFDAA
jgi:hypothetical protein